MPPYTALFVFAFGTIIGSFLNAVLWRLRTGEGIVFGRSYCPSCGHTLAAKDLVPVFSFLLLGGKCRYCRKGIHPSYLLVELAVGAMFVAFAWPMLRSAEGVIDGAGLARMLLHWYFAAALTLVFVYDLRYMLIPRSVTTPATVIAFAGLCLLGASPLSLAIGGLVGAGIFLAQYVVSKGKWIGGGDIHLGAMMGVMLGWPLVLVALFIAYVSGAVFGVTMLATGAKKWKSEIPFGTFLSAATLLTLLAGDAILHWYLSLLV